MLFRVLVNYLSGGTEFTFTRFVDDTEVTGQADVVQGRVEPTRVVWSVAKKHKP